MIGRATMGWQIELSLFVPLIVSNNRHDK